MTTVNILIVGAGEMAQQLRVNCSSEGPEFKSQQVHGGSQPPGDRTPSSGASEGSHSVLMYNNKLIFGLEQAGPTRASGVDQSEQRF